MLNLISCNLYVVKSQEAAFDADKVFLAAIDKFDAMMSKGNVYAPDGKGLYLSISPAWDIDFNTTGR